MTVVTTEIELQHREFLLQHTMSFVSGMCMGGLVSNSLQGAVASGCINAIFKPEVDYKAQMAAAAIFASIKYISRNLLNVDLTIITPLIIALFNREVAKTAAINSVVALPFIPEIYTTLSASGSNFFANTNIYQIYLRSSWQSTAAIVDGIVQYRFAHGLGILWAWGGITSFSKSLGQCLLQFDTLRRTYEFNIFQPYSGIMSLAGVFSFAGAVASAESMNYLTGRRFGDAKWLIPIWTLVHVMLIKYKLFTLDAMRKYSDRRILPLNHSVEIHRTMRLILAENEQEDTQVEELSDLEIRRIETEILQMLGFYEDHLNSSPTSSSPPSEVEISQLERHIAQLRIQLTRKPADISLRKFLESTESRLQNIFLKRKQS
ncbi:MAG: hypothetical protein K940chlam6_00615 [Chlamydiae bacterium]|nr:hypothetical protein [Chlamydiota bacterium]